MNVKVEKQPKSTIKLTVNVPNEKVKEIYENELAEVVKNAELPGFRKGMAPVEIVKEKVDTSKLYGDVINKLLQQFYTAAVNENHIQPIANPKIEIKEFDLEKDFEFTAITATRPEIKVKDFRKKLKELQEKKESSIKEENAKKLAAGETLEDSHAHLHTNEVIDVLLEQAEIEIPDLLIDEEADRMMARLVDQAQSIGLSLDQYLKAQNKTMDQLKEDYKSAAERTLKAEFVLSHLVKEEKIEVNDEDLVETVLASGAPDAEETLKDPVQRWYIKSVLEKNKLLNSLIEEIAHGHKE